MTNFTIDLQSTLKYMFIIMGWFLDVVIEPSVIVNLRHIQSVMRNVHHKLHN
jgi:hypothetical protein